MRTRKRAVFPTHVSSSVCAHERTKAKRARLSKFTTAAHFADQLRQQGFALLTPDDSTFFSIAAEALQGQLKVCGQRPEHAKFPGFQAFEHKQRLEYQAGSAVAPELVTLHQLTTEVSLQMRDTVIMDCNLAT